MPSEKSTDAPPKEYTKTLSYVVVDVSVRAISAIALVALGVASWRLQYDSQQQRIRHEQYDRVSRRYLPMYRTFSDLEMVLQDCAEELSLSRHGLERVPTLRECSNQLETAADAPFAVEIEPSGEVVLPALSATPNELGVRPIVSIGVALRASVLMVSDLLRVLALAESSMPVNEGRMAVVNLTIIRGQPTALVLLPSQASHTGEKREVAWHAAVVAPGIRSESVQTWRRWHGDAQVGLGQLSFMIGAICEAVHRQAIRANQGIMRQRPELGDQFVAIRQDALAEQSRRRESRRRTNAVVPENARRKD